MNLFLASFRHLNTLKPACVLLLIGLTHFLLSATVLADDPENVAVSGAPDTTQVESDRSDESQFLSGIRQLTFAGRRAGEGYFSRDGREMVFQSERLSENPFYQIYVMDRETGDIERVSPGHGKTTCAWIHPDGDQILFASTHSDPAAREKQAAELADRASGKQKRYAWDYDEHYELYAIDRATKEIRRLTDAKGYDAEASWSPDGEWIAFASNRHAYVGELSAEDQEIFERDKSYFNELYIMRHDGTQRKRLTNTPGYDGGPFFSPDGTRLCWRRFTPDGVIAEIMTMKLDGSDDRQITRLGAMSWAPYYHPSGRYLVFTTNKHGFENFELYIVAARGEGEANDIMPPVRVTTTEGFDGLPVFTPDGKQLAWTSTRTPKKQSQIFLADWNHEAALRKLGLESDVALESLDSSSQVAEDVDIQEAPAAAADTDAATRAANFAAGSAAADYRAQDMMRHVDYLCRPELEGRLTGTAGERMATAYVAAYFDYLGLQPAGDKGGWFQEFEFTAGISLAKGNQLATTLQQDAKTYAVDQQWRPLAFSAAGDFSAAPIVFAGYGIAAPERSGGNEPDDAVQAEYDSFVHLDVKDKWVLCFRFLPDDVTSARRQHLSRYSSLRFKAMQVRDRGAKGMIVVSGPTSQVKSQLVRLRFDGSLGGSSIPVFSVTDEVAKQWLAAAGKDLAELQKQLDGGDPMMGFTVGEIQLSASIALETEKKSGRNVLGRLPAGEIPMAQTVVVGAHIDHLGRGTGGSLAKGDEVNQIHFGADDNASGVAGLLEIAEYLSDLKRRGKLPARRDILFAGWSGEELGLLGASHFTKTYPIPAGHDHSEPNRPAEHSHAAAPSIAPHPIAPDSEKSNPHMQKQVSYDPHAASEPTMSLYPHIAACLNMDMIGRFEKRVVLQGAGSSSIWASQIEQRNVPVGLPITVQDDCYLPTDASAFFMRGVPILAAFTGSHSEYHTPRDTPDRLNYDDAARIAKLMGLVTRSLVIADEPPDFRSQQRPDEERPRAGLRAYLGTIPDYSQTDVKGVALSGVADNGPAAAAGVKGGDIVVELAGRKIENIYDYTYAIDALKIGEKVKIGLQRGEKKITLDVVPASRE